MKKQKSNLTSLAPLLLFVIFTTCILAVLLTGADVYQKVSRRDRYSFQHRTTAQYLTTRLRQSDAADMTFVGDFYNDLEVFAHVGVAACVASAPKEVKEHCTVVLPECMEGAVSCLIEQKGF